jgi:signal-transduction protein with cAMP-binding, CBS, and nucleotidyltransferase domain
MTSAKDVLFDEMALARNMQVMSVAVDADAVTYRLSFDVVLDRASKNEFYEAAGRHRRSTIAEIKRAAKAGLREFFSDETNPDVIERLRKRDQTVAFLP